MGQLLRNTTLCFHLLLAALGLSGLNACGGDTGGRVSAPPTAITTTASEPTGRRASVVM